MRNCGERENAGISRKVMACRVKELRKCMYNGSFGEHADEASVVASMLDEE